MLTNYDPNVARHAVHTVRITFMQWGYVGHIAYEIGGNCCGSALLNANFADTDTDEDIARYVENDCRFAWNNAHEMYTMTLHDTDGNDMLWDGSVEDLEETIVSIEFSAVRQEET